MPHLRCCEETCTLACGTRAICQRATPNGEVRLPIEEKQTSIRICFGGLPLQGVARHQLVPPGAAPWCDTGRYGNITIRILDLECIQSHYSYRHVFCQYHPQHRKLVTTQSAQQRVGSPKMGRSRSTPQVAPRRPAVAHTTNMCKSVRTPGL